MEQVWHLRFDSLHCLDPEEEDFFSDGDHPVLAVIAFASTWGQAGSTEVWRLPLDADRWPTGVDSGNVVAVPESVAVIQWPRIRTGTGEGLDSPINLLGSAVLAIEHDNTPLSRIGEFLDAAVVELRNQLRSLIEESNISLNPEKRREQLRRMRDSVSDAANPRGLEAALVLAESAGDPDDVSDPATAVFTSNTIAVDGDDVRLLTADLPVQLHLNYQAHFGVEVPVVDVFIGIPTGDFHYRLDGRLVLAQSDPEFAPLDADPACMPAAGQQEISLPQAIRIVLDGSGRRVRFEFTASSGSGRRVAYGREVSYDENNDAVVMSVVECANGRRVGSPWKIAFAVNAILNVYFLYYTIPDVDGGADLATGIAEGAGGWTGNLADGSTIKVTSWIIPALH